MKESEMKATKPLSMLIMLAVAIPAMAQMEITNSSLDIDGEWSERPSEAKRAEQLRKRLQKKTNDMVDTQIEKMRLKAEKQIGDQLEKALTGKGLVHDEVSSGQAAVINSKKQVHEVTEPKSLKIIPRVGFQNLRSDTIDFDSQINAGILFESMVQDRFAFGVGAHYTSMKILDPLNTFGGGFFNPYINNGFGNNWNEREINYRSGTLEIYGKFFLSHSARVRPFIGLGLEYSRSDMRYNDAGNNQFYYYNNFSNQLGGERYTYSSFGGNIQAGAEAKLTETFGLILDFKLAKGLNGQHARNTQANSIVFNPDLQRLEGIANEMSETTSTSVGLGMVVAF